VAAKERAGAQVNTKASKRKSRKSTHDASNYNFESKQQRTVQLQQDCVISFEDSKENKLQMSYRKQRSVPSVIRVLVPQITHEAMAGGIPTLEMTTGKLHDGSRW
jgi:hypothetical protein